MSKSFKFMLTLLLSIIVLAACNTAEEGTTEKSENETVTEHTEGTEVNQSVDTEKPAAEDGKQEGESAEDPETSITFTSNGENRTEELTSLSSEQITLQAIPDFTLYEEEPGRDVLEYGKDDSVLMRIEPMMANEAKYDDIVANTEEFMTSVNEEYEKYDISSFVEGQNVTNPTAYIAKMDGNEVIAVVFEKADKLVRLTLFDNEEADLSEAMLKMGLTIE